ncbi:MAG: dTDP-4-dehydrorhamnose reductase [Deltaproteobacteria bacterium]|nr:dTDP-4-dehydrorhamnose reductase [Deltaproteobacteria bacterium]
MKILLTGSNGQLGWELMNQSKAFGFEMKGVDLPQLDISDSVQVRNIVADYRPSLVINAAAYTSVDGAETEKDLAFIVNRDSPAHLAQLCSNEDIPLIHFSTDYVFNGNKKTPYKETDPASPLNIYGQSKLEGEINIRSTLKEHIIFRTSWLYGIYGHNFVKTMLGLGRERKSIQVVKDQYGSPTSTNDLSEAVLTIVSKIQNRNNIEWGTYHYCGQGITSWHGFAKAIFDIAKHITSLKIKHVEPVSSDAFASKATRPDFSALDCQRIKKHFGIHTKSWRQSLEIMINRLFNE